jgi:phosphohistidine phosphatase
MGSTGNVVRRLVLLRHAESEVDAGEGDHARILHERGRSDAARMGLRLRELGFIPQVVVSSDATRTRQTWEHLRESLGGAPDVTFTRTLYLVGIDEIRAALHEHPPEVDTVMAIGHNPGWEDAVHELCGVRARMMPCAAALLWITADTWADAAARSDWELGELVRPDAR